MRYVPIQREGYLGFLGAVVSRPEAVQKRDGADLAPGPRGERPIRLPRRIGSRSSHAPGVHLSGFVEVDRRLEPLKERLKRLLGGVTLRVRSGPLQGMRWTVASGSRFLGGSYEPETAGAMQEALRKGDVVFDIGAHVGYLTAVASLAVGESGAVYAFEPRPPNREMLDRHVRINDLTNVVILETGVAAESGTRRFSIDTGSGTGHLSETGALQIRTIALDEEIGAGRLPPPDLIKVDVEGAEAEVLAGARETLRRHRPALLISTHGPEPWKAVVEILEEAGYRLEPLVPEGAPGQTELLARPT